MKLLIKLFVFTVLIYNTSDCICSTNTNKISDNNKIANKNKIKKNKKEIKNNGDNNKQGNNSTKNNNNDKLDHNNKKDSNNKNNDESNSNKNKQESNHKYNTNNNKMRENENADNNNKDNNIGDEDTETDSEDDSDHEESNNNQNQEDNEDNDDENNKNDESSNESDDEDSNNEDENIREDDDDNSEEDDTEDGDDEEETEEEDDNDNSEEDDDEEYTDEDDDEDTEDEDTKEDDDEEDIEEEEDIDDPLEKVNRAVFAFNDNMNNLLDKFTSNKECKSNSKISPVSKAIGNFAHNFFETPRIINYALQGNIKNMSNTIARLLINTAFGFFGVADVAENFGFKKNRTYFGDTLKKWGMKPGPYVVLPILGPTSLRGAVGQAFETIPLQTAKLPINNLKPLHKNVIYYATYCSGLLATRAAYGDMIKQVSSMSKDKYKTFRSITMAMENS